MERLQAAVEAARALPFSFALTARADQYMHGRANLAEVVTRAQAFQAVGADMLLIPGICDPDEIATLCRSVDIPVAAIVGLSGSSLTLPEFGRIGVRRVIVGSAFARVAMTGMLAAAQEAAQRGTFEFAKGLIPFRELNELFRQLANCRLAQIGRSTSTRRATVQIRYASTNGVRIYRYVLYLQAMPQARTVMLALVLKLPLALLIVRILRHCLPPGFPYRCPDIPQVLMYILGHLHCSGHRGRQRHPLIEAGRRLWRR